VYTICLSREKFSTTYPTESGDILEEPLSASTCQHSLVQLLLCILQDIDSVIAKASEQGYSAFVTLGSRGISYAANVLVSTAAKV